MRSSLRSPAEVARRTSWVAGGVAFLSWDSRAHSALCVHRSHGDHWGSMPGLRGPLRQRTASFPIIRMSPMSPSDVVLKPGHHYEQRGVDTMTPVHLPSEVAGDLCRWHLGLPKYFELCLVILRPGTTVQQQVYLLLRAGVLQVAKEGLCRVSSSIWG